MTVAAVESGQVGSAGSSVFDEVESRVRLYCRKFPAVFTSARGSTLVAEDGREFLDFFCGAGALNYGHNDPRMVARLVEYLNSGGLLHGLDLHTTAKRHFLRRLRDVVLAPRGLDHRVQFCGPTGTDAVEAALKVTRKATGRRQVVAFTGAFHGMSHGSLSVTGSRAARGGHHLGGDTLFLPYEDGPTGRFDSLAVLAHLIDDPSGGAGPPAAVLVESLQMDGGVYPASADWLRALRELTAARGVPLVCDEIQAGCGRTGRFFGFEHAGIVPDAITLSKSLGGAGLPISVLLLRPELDVWEPGEHTGTFRGNQLAFVAGAAALDLWEDPAFLARLALHGDRMARFAADVRALGLPTRARGMVVGVDTPTPEAAARIQRDCYDRGLILETCGRRDTVLKVTPPLTITRADLDRGLGMLHAAIHREITPGREQG
ncbi:diaminobutyrate--2-oxoglutarate transaminase [Actinokineospora sp. PR83]|uniref:diaminobutyrate--2-oxoglutarate transaminase n=1 Tax=Actinokineospora sp. PR83 TaxID=2884908 RepID=UPI001F49241A|nr:diaminobutyrate--2-oxoglutarate transaminase [Actinokineospora sp. PR83]MCG8918404.1 diaminobutyrate--2-oxoglutarate transaminase [Actinokineospora sp. PR83]